MTSIQLAHHIHIGRYPWMGPWVNLFSKEKKSFDDSRKRATLIGSSEVEVDGQLRSRAYLSRAREGAICTCPMVLWGSQIDAIMPIPPYQIIIANVFSVK